MLCITAQPNNMLGCRWLTAVQNYYPIRSLRDSRHGGLYVLLLFLIYF